MFTRLVTLVAGTVLAASAFPCHAALTATSTQSATSLSGYTTSEISVSTTSDWLSCQGSLQLTSGTIYNDAFGSDTAPPNPAIVTAFPNVAFDTYVEAPGGLQASTAGVVSLTPTSFSYIWFDTAITDTGMFNIAQFTLSNDANGTFSFDVYNKDNPQVPFTYSGNIVNGVFTVVGAAVPEPASLGLLGAGAAALLMKRRSR